MAIWGIHNDIAFTLLKYIAISMPSNGGLLLHLGVCYYCNHMYYSSGLLVFSFTSESSWHALSD